MTPRKKCALFCLSAVLEAEATERLNSAVFILQITLRALAGEQIGASFEPKWLGCSVGLAVGGLLCRLVSPLFTKRKETAMSEPLETEVKLVCPAGLSEAEVGVALERMDLTVSWQEPEPQRDTYFDTTDGALLKANASLRLRCIGATTIGTFKLPQSQSGAVLELSLIHI